MNDPIVTFPITLSEIEQNTFSLKSLWYVFCFIKNDYWEATSAPAFDLNTGFLVSPLYLS